MVSMLAVGKKQRVLSFARNAENTLSVVFFPFVIYKTLIILILNLFLAIIYNTFIRSVEK